MKNILIWGAIIAVVIVGGYVYMKSKDSATLGDSNDFGSYEYVCDGGATFTMTPSSDLLNLTITPGEGVTFKKTILKQVASEAGARFEGEDMVFVGAGEGVRLTLPAQTLTCNPVPSEDMAPFNFGDAGEGGGVKPDTALVVRESIVGKWQSNEDTSFVREFKTGGAVTDTYSVGEVTNGTWAVYTKEAPLTVPFTLSKGVVYLQMTTGESPVEILNFKVTKLTPETLELVFMDRGGVLTFTSVK